MSRLNEIKQLRKPQENEVKNIIIDDKERMFFLSGMVFLLFAAIAIFMTVLNVITQRHTLMLATGIFSVLCLINLFLVLHSETNMKLAVNAFMVEIIVLFSYFIVTGGTDNFSIVWLLLLPTLGLFFFGIKKGTVMCAILFLIMMLAFHVPALSSIVTDYGETFRIRFPIVFVACYGVSLGLEEIRRMTADEMKKLKDRYEYQSTHDMLTGLLNRSGEEESLRLAGKLGRQEFTVCMMDIDRFKKVNDTYGHTNGDEILKQLSETVQSLLPEESVFFRWGGEEFFITFFDQEEGKVTAERIRQAVEKQPFLISEGREVRITVSLGVFRAGRATDVPEFQELMRGADECLYEAKNTGRNKVVTEEERKGGAA